DLRSVLNFGHSIGHALESLDAGLSHGEAVAIGMSLETRISELLGIAEPGLTTRLERVLAAYRLPTRVKPSWSISGTLLGVGYDKKRRDDEIVLALPEKVGAVGLYGINLRSAFPKLLKEVWK
ncbi:MAG: 3-dehydroquinate synthase family protein, partial [bacterium]